MNRTELLEKIRLWHDGDEQEKIIEAIRALPQKEWGYELTCLLARAYNNLAAEGEDGYPLLERAVSLLESVEEEGAEDHLWHYRTGYALFYLNREEEALMYFQRALELDPEDLDTRYFIEQCEKCLAAREQGEDDLAEEELEYAFAVTLHLNARFQPMHRHELEDALEDVLGGCQLGCVDGGGTAQMPSGEIGSCDIEISLADGSRESLDKLAEIIERMGVPKGSELLWNTGGHSYEQQAVGRLEGLALYLNGTELPAEVYESSDINFVIRQLDTLMDGVGSLYSWWEGPEHTALYFYGESYAQMLDAAKDFLAEYPLCQKCRVEQIA